jgi:hypothetical protein
VKKTHQLVWDSLIDYGSLEWQSTLQDLIKAMDIAYEDVLRKFDKVWCVKGFIVTCSNLVTWKVRPQMSIIS